MQTKAKRDQRRTKFPPNTRKYSGKRPEKSEEGFRRAEKIWKRYLLNWGKLNEGFVREALSYDFLTVADDGRVRNSGIHVVVDYVSLNDFY